MKKSSSLISVVLASTLWGVPSAYADLTVSAVLTDRDTTTAVDGNIIIDRNGQLNMTGAAPNGGDAIVMNSAAATVTIDAANVHPNAIQAAVGDGINIAPGGTAAAITVGANSTIQAAGNAIVVDETGAGIYVSGTLTATNNAIQITANGTNTVVSLLAGATVTATGVQPTMLVNGTLSFGNDGTVSSAGPNVSAIVLQENINNFQNNATGVIAVTGVGAGAGSAIVVNKLNLTGDINNRGIITVGNDTGSAINIQNTFNGSINNLATGTISNTGGGGAGAASIAVNAGFGKIDNQGSILGTQGVGILVNVNSAGVIDNRGLIESANNQAIGLGGDLTQITNSGTVRNTSLGSATIAAGPAAVNVLNGIQNTGTITNLQAGGTALNLVAGNDIVLTQAGGSITGNVLLASGGGEIFYLTGGTITGDVSASNAAANTLTLSGGTLDGTLMLGNMGDTVELSGSSLQDIVGGIGADTINVTGGSFQSLDGTAGADELNVETTLTVPGVIQNIPTINVNAGTFTVNGQIAGLGTLFDIAAGATVYANSDITGAGDFTQAGTLYIVNDSIVNLTGVGGTTNSGIIAVDGGSFLQGVNYTQTATGIFVPVLDSTVDYGQIVLTGAANLMAGSLIYPYFTPGAFLPAGTTFDVITAPGMIVDNSSVLQPGSTTVYFTKSLEVGNTILRLMVARNSYQSVVQGIDPDTTGVASVLDQLANNGTNDPTLQELLGQLDALSSAQAMEQALISLEPTVNYALVQGSYISMDSAFSSVLYRVETLQHLKPLGAEEYAIFRPREYYTGQNYGDSSDGITGVWIRGYGSLLNQKFYKNWDGYKGDSVGYAMGADWGSIESIIAGFALSYTNTHTVGSSQQANIVNIRSIQGTFYTWFEPFQSIFMDVLFGFSSNRYDSRRNIGIGTLTTSAFATFNGYQYAVQTDVGYAFTYDTIYVAPIGRFKYSYLGIDSYTEEGAAGINLSVDNDSLNEMTGGVGFKLVGSKKFAQARYVPALCVLVLYDFYGDGQDTSSNFIGGGGLFPTDGPRPSHAYYLLEAGVTAYTYDRYAFEIKYDLQIRDRYHYYGNSLYMQLRGEWG